MEEKDYLQFFEKYAQNRHTDAEHTAFLSWFETLGETDALYVMDQYFHVSCNYPSPEALPANRELMNKIEARLDGLDTREKDRRNRWKWGWRYAAAALVILTGYAGYDRLYHSDAIVPDQSRHEISEIVPGNDRAVLTLTDGSSVVLNDVGEGTIATQAGVSVTKAADGHLVYTPGRPDGHPHAYKERTAGIFNTITTPKAGQYRIHLPDGTKVWLNSFSSLRFPVVFDEEERRVEVSGEAYFEVATIKGRHSKVPFRVISNNQIVEVTGTCFNVSSYNDEQAVRTTLLEGGVTVSVQKTGQTVKLEPGEQSILDLATGDNSGAARSGQDPVVTVQKADVEEVMAWKDGYFRFMDTGIDEIMRQLIRWYDIEVEYKGPLPSDRFTGFVSRNVQLPSVLEMLSQGGDVAFTVSGRKIVVTTAVQPPFTE